MGYMRTWILWFSSGVYVVLGVMVVYGTIIYLVDEIVYGVYGDMDFLVCHTGI